MGYSSSGKLANFGREQPMVDAARRTVERVGDDLLERTKGHTPVAKPPPQHEAEWLAARKRMPGELRDSWKVGEVTVEDGGRSFSVDVYTLDRIAPYVEWPTQPHLIVPKAGGMLRYWDALGNTVFAKLIHHPGTGGAYMLTTSIAEIAVAWQDIGAEEMEAWAEEQARGVSA